MDYPLDGSRTIPRSTISRRQFVIDNSSWTILRKIKYSFYRIFCLHFATFLSSIPLPFQQHSFHHSHFHYSNNTFNTPASISSTFFSSILLLFQQQSFHHSRFHFSNILFVDPVSISATYFHHSCFYFSNISFMNPASISANILFITSTSASFFF